MESNVRLVAVTKPMIDECETAEQLIAYCARVSNPKNQASHDTAGKLLRYLLEHAHWSPLEMAHMVLEITTTRDIGRQILRHRSFSFQEFSQRYAEVDDSSFRFREARLQDLKNRQNSIIVEDETLQAGFREAQQKVQEMAKLAYKEALDLGIAKEQARALLPEGMTLSRMYMSGTIRSWVHYCQLRRDVSTQLEHREIAEQCWQILCEQFPAIREALDD